MSGTSQCSTVTILEDEEIEGDETFTLQLQSNSATIEQGRDFLVVTIIDGKI